MGVKNKDKAWQWSETIPVEELFSEIRKVTGLDDLKFEHKIASDRYDCPRLEFTSQDYEGVQLAKFTSNYGKIIYTSSDGFSKEVVPTSVLANRDYLGKMLYIKVPNEIESAKTIDFIYTVRNNKYSYKIR